MHPYTNEMWDYLFFFKFNQNVVTSCFMQHCNARIQSNQAMFVMMPNASLFTMASVGRLFWQFKVDIAVIVAFCFVTWVVTLMQLTAHWANDHVKYISLQKDKKSTGCKCSMFRACSQYTNRSLYFDMCRQQQKTCYVPWKKCNTSDFNQ